MDRLDSIMHTQPHTALWHDNANGEQPCAGITMLAETRLRISFLLTYMLTVKLFTLFVESGLGQHAIGFFEVVLGKFWSGPIGAVRVFPLGTISYTNKQTNFSDRFGITPLYPTHIPNPNPNP